MDLNRKIQLSVSFALSLILLYYDVSGMFFCFLTAAAVHELLHAGAVTASGARIIAFDISPFGGSMSYSPLASYRADMVIALAGPLGSFAAAYAASAAARLTDIAWLYRFSGTSLMLGAFNLLPVMPLDGGNIMNAMLTQKLGSDSAFRRMNSISVIFCTILILLGLYIFVISRYNITMLFIAVWLMIYNIRRIRICLKGDISSKRRR